MMQALRRAEWAAGFNKVPIREVCRWNKHIESRLKGKPSVLKSTNRSKISVQTQHGPGPFASNTRRLVLTTDAVGDGWAQEKH
jgi:hypothetical protein